MEQQKNKASTQSAAPQEEQLRQWAATWQTAGEALEAVRREELRNLDGEKAVALLLGHFDYTQEPYAPKPTSGLVEQQRIFMKIAGRD